MSESLADDSGHVSGSVASYTHELTEGNEILVVDDKIGIGEWTLWSTIQAINRSTEAIEWTVKLMPRMNV